MNNKQELYTIINKTIKKNKKEVTSVLTQMGKDELILKEYINDILSGSFDIKDLRQEELIWFTSELEDKKLIKGSAVNYFSNLELSNAKFIKSKMSTDIVFRLMTLYREIYNPEQKAQYIKENYGNQDEVSIREKINFFNAVAEIENKHDCDICNFNEEQLYDLFSSLNLLTLGSFCTRRSIITLYYEWCYNHNLITENQKKLPEDIDFDKIDSSKKLKAKYFKDWNDLKGYVDTIISYLDNEVIDSCNTQIALLYLSWNGISIKDAVKIKIKDLDIKNNCIHIGNKTVEIENSDMAEFLEMYSKETEYETYGLHNVVTTKQYANDIFLIRNTLSQKELTIETVRGVINSLTRLSKKFDNNDRYFDIKADYTNTAKSSLFSKMYELEKNIGELTLYNLECVDFVLKFGYTDRMKYSALIQEYKKWRKYFYNY